MTKIAVLGWGSLVWDPRDLQAAAQFAPNGPLLPIEFCRVSNDGRLTLAVDETFGAVCTTYSAPSALQSLDAAIENLRSEKGCEARAEWAMSSSLPADRATSRCNGIRKLSRPSRPGRKRTATTPRSGRRWRATSRSSGKGGEPFSVTAALSYLEELEKRDAAKFRLALDYVRRAPIEVQTPVRDEVQKRWPA